MTGDETENVPDQTPDAAPAAPDRGEPAPTSAPDDAVASVPAFDVPEPETIAAPDAETVIEEFEVPAPPQFGAASSSAGPEPVIPSAPSSASASADAPALRARSTWTPDDSWSPASAHKQEAAPTAAQKAESRAAASRAATARDEATRNYVSPASGGTAGQSYRGWTIAIYGGLAVLFFGAIGFMAFLGLPG